jgi:hypothetical protein
MNSSNAPFFSSGRKFALKNQYKPLIINKQQQAHPTSDTCNNRKFIGNNQKPLLNISMCRHQCQGQPRQALQHTLNMKN